MLNSLKRVVPWINRNEWEVVFSKLFSEFKKDRKEALDRILIWKSRSNDCLSIAIDLTWNLLSTIHKDQEYETLNIEQEFQLRNIYSMSIIRFINLLLESYQDKNYMTPLHKLAKELNIPSWIVDLRHEATHGTLPSLFVLRAASNAALQYLKESYWEKQLMENYCQPNECIDNQIGGKYSFMEEILNEYIEFSLVNQSKIVSTRLKNILSKFENLAQRENQIIILGLIKCKLFINNDIEEFKCLGLTLKDFSANLSLPDKLVNLWKELLCHLTNLQLLEQLTINLAENITEVQDEYSFKNLIISSWISFLLISAQETKTNPQISKIEFPHKCNFDGDRLLDIILSRPIYYTPALLPSILSWCKNSISNRKKLKLLELTGLYCSNKVDNYKGSSLSFNKEGLNLSELKFWNIADILKEENNMKKLENDNYITNENNQSDQNIILFSKLNKNNFTTLKRAVWKLEESINWSNCKLGCIPGKSIVWDSYQLPIELDLDENNISSDRLDNITSLAKKQKVSKSINNKSNKKKYESTSENIDKPLQEKSVFIDLNNICFY